MKNLRGIIGSGLCARNSLTGFEDIAIEVCDSKRGELNLLDYIPFFVGSHKWWHPYDFNGFLMTNGYYWKFANRSFYGSLNKTLRNRMAASQYGEIVILMLKEEVIRIAARNNAVRLFDNIAIKDEAAEVSFSSENELFTEIEAGIEELPNGQFQSTSELDIRYDHSTPLKLGRDFECILVDTDAIKSQIQGFLNGQDIPIYVTSLPRDDSVSANER